MVHRTNSDGNIRLNIFHDKIKDKLTNGQLGKEKSILKRDF